MGLRQPPHRCGAAAAASNAVMGSLHPRGTTLSLSDRVAVDPRDDAASGGHRAGGEAARAAKGVDHLHILWGRVVAVSLSTQTRSHSAPHHVAHSQPLILRNRPTESSASTWTCSGPCGESKAHKDRAVSSPLPRGMTIGDLPSGGVVLCVNKRPVHSTPRATRPTVDRERLWTSWGHGVMGGHAWMVLLPARCWLAS